MNNFDFKHINLVPQMGIVESRDECDPSVILGKHKFNLPIYPANMESIIDRELAIQLAEKGYFYTTHRFNFPSESFIRTMKSKKLISSISIGVNYDSYRLLEKLEDLDLLPDYLTIDIAHGHCVKMKKMLEHIKSRNWSNTFVIAGNICTEGAAINLIDWGADAIKVGIAPGYVCTTAIETGFGSRGMQASTIGLIKDALQLHSAETAESKYANAIIICDGGIRERGDIAKALACGADLVMAGSMFAGFQESPGNLIEDPITFLGLDGQKSGSDRKFKEYWGSASQYSAGKSDRIEGKKTLIPYKDKSIFDEMQSIKESLQSAISYAGGRNLSAFENVELAIIN